ncbi:TrkH family potassium uptake protein [Anaerosporobacter faecicola]|uniref:TrkH family potassium uptake protein n=1 Tax=Anaerosporobacter faecicola TaxID=2718714 RepID=UPI002ED36839
MKDKLKKIKFSTTQMIVFGFLAAIILGTALLMLPFATREGETTKLVDALFTATTSICVTGLTTVNTLSHWTTFGHIVILILIQFGGLGVITFTTTILLIMRKRITLRERLLIQEAYNLDTLRGLVRLTIKIMKGTFLVEGIGALLYSFSFIPKYGFFSGLGRAIFNAVSAFCNAGMDILGEVSLADYVSDPLVNFTTMALIILGGIGFPVWWDVLEKLKKSFKEKFHLKTFLRSLRLHTKIAVGTTIILILTGTVVIFIMEYNNKGTIGNLGFGSKVMASMFQSVTTRTAGFFTIPQENLTSDSAFISIVLMFIGGSPSGTAGGVKTVTIAMIFLAAISIVKGKQDVELHRRKIADFYIKKALAVILVSASVLFISTILLSVVEGGNFLDVMFETTSALATVGLTRGITPTLTTVGKVIIVITMYLGRIGPMSMALAFNLKSVKGNGKHLPEENISVG